MTVKYLLLSSKYLQVLHRLMRDAIAGTDYPFISLSHLSKLIEKKNNHFWLIRRMPFLWRMLWNTCLKRAVIFEYVNKIPQLDMFFSVPHSWLHQEMVNSNRSNHMNTSM